MGFFLAFFMALCPVDYNPAQVAAQIRVDYMAKYNHCWHPPFYIGKVWGTGARFEGAGWGRRNRDPKTLGTCQPHRRRRMKIIADAVAKGKWGSYRIRLWR